MHNICIIVMGRAFDEPRLRVSSLISDSDRVTALALMTLSGEKFRDGSIGIGDLGETRLMRGKERAKLSVQA